MDEDPIDSDENDDDYVPSEEESDYGIVSEDELEESSRKQKNKGKRKQKQTKSKRKRRKAGIQLEEEEEEKEVDDSEDDDDDDDDDETTEMANTDKSAKHPAEDEKKKADSLWADFLKDVDPPPKSKLVPVSKPQTQMKEMKDQPVNTAIAKKTTITQLFNFAGESVSVTKEIDANSDEAKQHADSKDDEKTKEEVDNKANLGGVKRTGSIGNVLGQIGGKKSTLNTLEKSRLDWETFKKTENIEDELRLHNKGKDGYLDRQAFLQRVDVRQFELEKDIRAINRSKR